MNWGTICCSAISCLQLYWTRLVIRKWFNVSSFDSDYSADTDDDRPSLSPSQGHTSFFIFYSFRLILKSFLKIHVTETEPGVTDFEAGVTKDDDGNVFQ